MEETGRHYFEAFFGNDSDTYMPKLEEYQSGKRFFFSIGGFVFGLLWLIYRKLYWQVLITFAVAIALGFIQELLLMLGVLGTDGAGLFEFISLLLISLYISTTGHYFVIRRAISKTGSILAAETEEELRLLKLKKAGKGNITLVIVAVLLILVLSILGTYS